jgi:uncharacterized protein YacL
MQWLQDTGSLLTNLTFVSFLTETIIEFLKVYLLKYKHSDIMIYTFSMIIGILLCFAFGISLFNSDNPTIVHAGSLIAGMVASRGANYIHNFLGQLK